MGFALVETGAARPSALVGCGGIGVKSGERLLIGADAATLRTVLEAFACMIRPPASVRVYLCLSPCATRKSFDSLHASVRRALGTGRLN